MNITLNKRVEKRILLIKKHLEDIDYNHGDSITMSTVIHYAMSSKKDLWDKRNIGKKSKKVNKKFHG